MTYVYCKHVHTTYVTKRVDDAALKEKKKRDESKPPTRIPGMRAAGKLLSKIVSDVIAAV